MADRQIVVVDVETTGLDPDTHIAVEVAWWNLTTAESGVFVPPHSWRDAIGGADLEALQTNRYVDRLAGAGQDTTGAAGEVLWRQLQGNTFAGCNPAFDAQFVGKMYDQSYSFDWDGVDQRPEWYVDEPPRWHHRLLDLSVYAAGVLGIPVTELPGLAAVCERLGVPHVDAHTAWGDVAATGLCFRALFKLQAARHGDQRTATADCQVRRPPYHSLHADIVGHAAYRLAMFTDTAERAREIAREIADKVLPPDYVAKLDALPDTDEEEHRHNEYCVGSYHCISPTICGQNGPCGLGPARAEVIDG